ncbi:MAG: hypothetical protein QGI68_06650 [Pseudomonadales bacterium]|jgi:hypothetical protein|nr:hypothetical protein [Pseudomonadales bacterium]
MKVTDRAIGFWKGLLHCSGLYVLLVASLAGALGQAPAIAEDGDQLEDQAEAAEEVQDDHDPRPDADIEEIRVSGSRTDFRTPLSISLDTKQLEKIPGTQDDPLRAIVTLPGVAVNNDFEGGVAVRGSRPGDNRYFLDFLPVGYLFHLTGLSVVDGDLVSGFSLYPAGFGVEYQGVTGAVIDASTRDPASDGRHGVLDASILDAGVLFEVPVSESQRGIFSARASYYDLILGRVIEKINEDENEGVDIVQLPRYRDYRGRYQFDIGESSTLDLFVDAASDEVALLFEDTASAVALDPAVAGSHRFELQNDRQGAVFNRAGSTGQELQIGVGRIRTLVRGRFGGVGRFETDVVETTLRAANRFEELGRHMFKVGGSVSDLDVDYDIVIRDNGCTEFDVDCRFSDDEVVTTV